MGKPEKKFHSRMRKLRRFKAAKTVPDVDEMVRACAGLKQTQVIDSCIRNGLLDRKQIEYVLTKTGACKSQEHAHARVTRHFRHDTDKKIRRRVIIEGITGWPTTATTESK